MTIKLYVFALKISAAGDQFLRVPDLVPVAMRIGSWRRAQATASNPSSRPFFALGRHSRISFKKGFGAVPFN